MIMHEVFKRMKKNLFKLFYMMLFVILSTMVLSNNYCQDYQCGNIFYEGNEVMTIDSSSWLNYNSNLSYGQCYTGNALFQPIAYDYDDDGSIEIASVTSATEIKIYNNYCNEEASITLNESITSALSLNDYDDDGLFDLIVLTNSSLRIYSSETLELLDSHYYLSYTGDTELTQLGCAGDVCFTRYRGTAYVFNIIANVIFYDDSVTFTALYQHAYGSLGSVYFNAPTQEIDGVSYVTYCMHSTTRTDMFCHVIDQDLTVTDLEQDLGSFYINDLYYYNAGFVKMGTIYRFVLSYLFQKNDAFEKTGMAVYDDSFNAILEEGDFCPVGCGFGGEHAISMAVVGDYDKDGDNEFCYFSNKTNTAEEAVFTCYSNTFTTPIYNETFNLTETGMSHFPFMFFMGDVDNSDDYKGIITFEGMYKMNPDESSSVLNSSLTYTPFTDKKPIGFLTVDTFSLTEYNFIGDMVYYYADSDEAVLFRPGLSGAVCGDGVCSSEENIFTCPQDCAVSGDLVNTTGYPCTSDDQCFSGYCINGVCEPAPEGYECNLDSQCLSGLCLNHKCTRPSLWQLTNQSKKEMWGDDAHTNNLLSIIFAIVLSGMIIFGGRGHIFSIVLAGGAFYACVIFFGLVGWLSKWLVFVLFVIPIFIAIALMILFGRMGD